LRRKPDPVAAGPDLFRLPVVDDIGYQGHRYDNLENKRELLDIHLFSS
jgi:hypothetical protein